MILLVAADNVAKNFPFSQVLLSWIEPCQVYRLMFHFHFFFSFAFTPFAFEAEYV